MEEKCQRTEHLFFQLLNSTGHIVFVHKKHEKLHRFEGIFWCSKNISFPLHCFNFRFVLSALMSLRRVFWQEIRAHPLPPLKHLDQKGFGGPWWEMYCSVSRKSQKRKQLYTTDGLISCFAFVSYREITLFQQSWLIKITSLLPVPSLLWKII